MNGSRNHIGKDDFRRYLNNRMTDAERNAFERELQKHPFEAEALEGFQQVRDADLDNDLLEISAKIPVKRSRNNIRYLTVAATFLVQVNRKTTDTAGGRNCSRIGQRKQWRGIGVATTGI
jgi:hypothetical protein